MQVVITQMTNFLPYILLPTHTYLRPLAVSEQTDERVRRQMCLPQRVSE